MTSSVHKEESEDFLCRIRCKPHECPIDKMAGKFNFVTKIYVCPDKHRWTWEHNHKILIDLSPMKKKKLYYDGYRRDLRYDSKIIDSPLKPETNDDNDYNEWYK